MANRIPLGNQFPPELLEQINRLVHHHRVGTLSLHPSIPAGQQNVQQRPVVVLYVPVPTTSASPAAIAARKINLAEQNNAESERQFLDPTGTPSNYPGQTGARNYTSPRRVSYTGDEEQSQSHIRRRMAEIIDENRNAGSVSRITELSMGSNDAGLFPGAVFQIQAGQQQQRLRTPIAEAIMEAHKRKERTQTTRSSIYSVDKLYSPTNLPFLAVSNAGVRAQASQEEQPARNEQVQLSNLVRFLQMRQQQINQRTGIYGLDFFQSVASPSAAEDAGIMRLETIDRELRQQNSVIQMVPKMNEAAGEARHLIKEKASQLSTSTEKTTPLPDVYHLSSDEEVEQVVDKPKRCLSAYNLFFRDEREKILHEIKDAAKIAEEGQPKKRGRKKKPKIKLEEMVRIISDRWRKIDDKRKAYYDLLAKQDKKRHNEEMKAYSTSQKRQKVC